MTKPVLMNKIKKRMSVLHKSGKSKNLSPKQQALRTHNSTIKEQRLREDKDKG